jgi:uncharacterized repeat protein (TIGR01451 family)
MKAIYFFRRITRLCLGLIVFCSLIGVLDRIPTVKAQTSVEALIRSQQQITKPAGTDLDVTHISRTPMYNSYSVLYTADGRPYLKPGTESDKRWPSQGEIVTFTAHIINKGTVNSGNFSFSWYVDGSEVASGTHSSLSPNQTATETYQWAWAHASNGDQLLGEHTIMFMADSDNAISETYKSNNFIEDRTDALSLNLLVTPELYNALEIPIDPKWPFSAEDWLQKQITAMNDAFIRSTYSSIPNGITERVRLDQIIISSSALPGDPNRDGSFFMSVDDRQGNGYYDPVTDVSGALIHELTHQLGIIDMYNLGVALETPQVLDKSGQPIQMEFSPDYLFPGLMINPGIQPPIYDEHSALALNANKGYRRGYYGEYLYDIPNQVYLHILDNQGQPAIGVTVKLYQRSSDPGLYGGSFGTIDNTPEITGVTDGSGNLLLPNRSVNTTVTTKTGHILHDNPFGLVNVVGINDEFILELIKGAHQEFLWLDITAFNLAMWQGSGSSATLDIPSHVPPSSAPIAPPNLIGKQVSGLVMLQWSASSSPDVIGYNIYRTDNSAYPYQLIDTGIPDLSYSEPYDYGFRAATYVITAINSAGKESGFSDPFYSFRLSNPAGLIVDDQNGRIVLDPQNGYALLYQRSNGVYSDTRGSYDTHLEFSQYIARDSEDHLIISHPADFYSSRHSIRILDKDARPMLEFGEQGSGTGQFETPAGVAVWGQPCSIEGPYSIDTHTLLLLPFDNSYNGAQGETGSAKGISFTSGKYTQAVTINSTDTLTYATTGNLNRTQGAIEFWIRPSWNGGDNQSYTFFEVGSGWFNRMRIMKDGANNLRFMVWDSATEYGVAHNIADWQAGEWHHIAATWIGTNIALYIDGEQLASSNTAHLPDTLANTIYVGSSLWLDQQANADFDELRISDNPRVGNSDTCAYRILVADSGNNRIQAFDGQGNFISAYGSSGSGPGQFNNPQGVAVDNNGDVVVVDSYNNRLQVLSFDGLSFDYLRTITASLNEPTGVATYGSNLLLVADTGNNKIKVLDAQGNLLAEYDAPNDGSEGTFNQPRGVAPDRSGSILVADTGNKRVVSVLGVLPVLPLNISGNAGVGGAILSYTDGIPMTVTADSSGAYSLTVAFGWNGTVTPSKTGYIFTPDSRSYTNVTSDLTAENYTAISPPKPGIPVLVSPANGVLTTNYRPKLDWSDASSADHYLIQVATSNTFASPIIEQTIHISEYTPDSDLSPNTTYYWRVNSYNAASISSNWSAVRYFRTALLPPTLTAPSDAENLLTNRPTFDWDDASGATSYTVQISRNLAFTSLVGTYLVTPSIYTPTANLPANISLYWRVQSRGTNGPSAWSTIRSLKTANPPSVPFLLSPALNALTTDYTPRLDWATSTVPTGTVFDHYQIQVDDTADFLSTTVDQDVLGPTSHEYTLTSDLNPNTKYFWRVRSYNTAGEYSAWSLVRYFRTAILPPTLGAPADASTVLSLRPTFDWGDVTGASGYTIQISKNNTFTLLVVNTTITGATKSGYTPTTNLPVNTTLYWRVRASGVNGPSAWSLPTWSFITPNPPGVPVPTSPVLNALVTNYSPTLKWNKPSLPTTAGSATFKQYEVQIAIDLAFSTVIQAGSVTDYLTPQYAISPALDPNMKYYWRLRAVDMFDHYSLWSTVYSFRTAILPPTLIAPEEAFNLLYNRPIFDWYDVTGASGYTLQIAKNSTFTLLVGTYSVTPSTYTSAASLPANITLWWRVQAKGTNGPSLWSTAWTVNTANPPSVPVLVSPSAGAVLTDYTPLFDWSNSTVPTGTTFQKYEFQLAANSSFTGPTSADIPGLPSNSQYTPVSDLNPSTLYYWRVRAFNTDGEYSTWSLVRNFRTAPPPPDLAITKTHAGDFHQGQIGATYTILVRNIGQRPTSGVVTVTDTLPAGLTATTLSGSGWNCALGTLTCSRNTILAGGASYPAITLKLNVANTAPTSLTNVSNVSGGGDSNASNNVTDDITLIGPDIFPPAAIADLAAKRGILPGTVKLTWTAPGDDGMIGTATSYLVRYSSNAITDENTWNAATVITSGIPMPLVGGSSQSMIVTDLTPGNTYYFSMRTQDDAFNLDGLSNSPSAQAQINFDPKIQTQTLLYNEARTVYLGNLARRNNGIPPLRWSSQLTYAARWFSWDSIENRPSGFCGHQDTLGSWPGDRAYAFGYLGGAGAENAFCGYVTPESAIQGWMNDGPHRANLLEPNSREIGLGYYRRDSDGRGYVTQDFGNDPIYAPVIIENEAISTTSPDVNLYIYNRSTGGGFAGLGAATQMMVSNNANFSGATWEPYKANKIWTLISGEGWREVYVKTRDIFNRDSTASDTIYLGANIPLNEIGTAQMSTTQSQVTLFNLNGGTLPQVQFSLGWLADDTFGTFNKWWGNGERVNDTTAWGGTTYRLYPGDGESFAWVYDTTFIKETPLVAYFRLKVNDNTSNSEVARISVQGGPSEYGPLSLLGTDFTAPNQYQEFALNFTFSPTSDDPFLFFKFWRSGSADLYVDAVSIFSTPQAITSPLTWSIPGKNYRGQGIWVRYTNGSQFSNISEGIITP